MVMDQTCTLSFEIKLKIAKVGNGKGTNMGFWSILLNCHMFTKSGIRRGWTMKM